MHGLTACIDKGIFSKRLSQRISPVQPLWTRALLLPQQYKQGSRCHAFRAGRQQLLCLMGTQRPRRPAPTSANPAITPEKLPIPTPCEKCGLVESSSRDRNTLKILVARQAERLAQSRIYFTRLNLNVI